jgi:hypothetical protein
MNLATLNQYLDIQASIETRCSWWVQCPLSDFYIDLIEETIKIWSCSLNCCDDTDFAEIPLDVFLSTDTKQEADKVKARWEEEARLKRHEEEQARKKKEKLDKIEADKKKEESEYLLWQTLNKKYGSQ